MPSALGLYVHVPFCAAICNYCNFSRGLFDASLKSAYLDALVREIRAAGDGSIVDTIFFGGGTPSLLDPGDIAEVVRACGGGFSVSPASEVTLEANPETVTADRLDGFLQAGVNRVSFGVQSFRDDELRRLSRLHSSSRAADALADARRVGFSNVSLDLMMWLPGQSIAQWLESVDRLVSLEPEHASLYLLEIYPNAPLRDAMARAQWSVAPDDDAADMYLAAMDRLDAAGYEQYEISNVARGGRRSRHNLKYWTDGEWLGFGPSAHSTRAGVRWKNVSGTEDYVARVTRGEAPLDARRVLSARDRVEEALFMGLRLTDGVDLAEFAVRHGMDVWNTYGAPLEKFIEAGVLIYDGGRMRLTRAGFLLANEVMAVFVNSGVR